MNRSVVIPSAPVVAACVAAGLALAPSAARAQEGQIIGSVVIRGTENTNREIVRLALGQTGIAEGAIYREISKTDARRLIRDKGYYSDVFIKAEVGKDNQVTVTVEVFENPKITDVRIKGNTVIPAEKILPLLGSQAGTVLNVNTLREDVQKINSIYRQEGFEGFVLELEGDDVFDPKTNILTFNVSETIVDSIVVEKNDKPGEPLNAKTLGNDIRRIYNTGLFANVQVGRVETIAEGRARVYVVVEEQRTGQVQVGLGYSVQQRLTGTLEIAEQNFRGRGQSMSAAWTVGGTVARNQFEVGFTEPWLDKNNTSLGVNLYDRFLFRFNRILSSNATDGTNNNPYFEQRRGGSITLSRPTSEFGRAFVTVRTENVRANNLQPDYNQLTNDEINSLRGALVQNGNVNSLTGRYLINRRDNEMDPAEGYFLSPAFELGRANFQSQRPRVNPEYVSPEVTPGVPRVLVDQIPQNGAFTKLNVDFRRYINVDRRGARQDMRDGRQTIAMRLLAGTSTGNINFSEQYFIGGADDLRGYFDGRFWGNNLFLFSTEYRYPFDKRNDFTGVLFVDVGDAWGGSDINRQNIPGFGQHTGFRPNVGVGFGVRFRTPVGPVRLDLGFGETTRTHFSIGPTF
jgi:outer membrane protein insertion porin family